MEREEFNSIVNEKLCNLPMEFEYVRCYETLDAAAFYMVKATLTKGHIILGKVVGMLRREFNQMKKTPDRYGLVASESQKVKMDIEGALAELSVAKFLNLNWAAFSEQFKFLRADVGENVQVRGSSHPEGNLLLHEADKDESVFIFAMLEIPKDVTAGQISTLDSVTIYLRGWIYARDGKQSQYWEDGSTYPSFKGRPCFRFPRCFLKSMTSLPNLPMDFETKFKLDLANLF